MFAGTGIIAVLFAVCVVVLGLVGMEPAEWRTLFFASYPPMIISIRAVEGMLLGTLLAAKARLWQLPVFIVFAVLLYFALCKVPPPVFRVSKTIWVVGGAILASRKWTRMVSGSKDFPFNGTFSGIAIFLVFMSTMLYVQSSPFDQMLFQWVFPLGFMIGLLAMKKYRRNGQHQSNVA
jgi:hypothetical protein